MIDIVFPRNNEQEFIKLAEKLGFKELIFLYTSADFPKSNSMFKIKQALLLPTSKVNIAHSKKLPAFHKGHDNAREAIERDFDVVFAVEDDPRTDHLHFRNSGLNHVLCRLASKNDVRVGFSFSSVLHSNKRNIIMGRMMQNIRFCRKFKVKTIIASFARTPFDMRAPSELRAFFETLGMTSKEASQALNWL